MPFLYLSNGEEVWFLNRDTDAHAQKIAGVYSQDDLCGITLADRRTLL